MKSNIAFPKHVLIPHGKSECISVPRDFDGIKAWLETSPFEGIVWHHPDGRMVKIKRKDFFKKVRS